MGKSGAWRERRREGDPFEKLIESNFFDYDEFDSHLSLSLSLRLDFRSTLRYTRGEGVCNLPVRPPATRNTTRNRCNIGSGCVITLLTPVIAFNPRSSSSRVGWREERRSRKRESSSARWPRSSWSQMGVNLGFSRGCFNFDGSGFGRCCFRGLRACNPSFEREQFGAC